VQDLIAKGMEWFESQRREHLAVNVSYRPRDSQAAVAVPATIGMTRWDSLDAAGQMIRFETRDFLVGVTDYASDPKRGDVISETDYRGVIRQYEVSVPGGANNPWSWADRGQRIRRIHTQLIDTILPTGPTGS
jgi:hypothetical protein